MEGCGVFWGGGSPPPAAELHRLVDQLQLPLAKDIQQFPLTVLWSDSNWGLVSRNFPRMKPLVVNFLESSWLRRLTRVGGSGDILSKALKKVSGNKAMDGTAGLGRDTLHLLALGFEVVAVERHPLFAELLHFAHHRALESASMNQLFQHLTIVTGDSTEFLQSAKMNHFLQPDVVFLDPMFPDMGKSSLSGKEIRFFQMFVSPSPQSDLQLLNQALSGVKDRVVVKRPKHAQALMNGARHSHSGKSVRYDIYFPNDFQKT